ncbi:MAG: hypothetical protein HWN67_22890, partial [Candidatus Helarchaeota archaeon]|nr:hypothetical protein [Candidatus Helarchaeota archaeon]
RRRYLLRYCTRSTDYVVVRFNTILPDMSRGIDVFNYFIFKKRAGKSKDQMTC